MGNVRSFGFEAIGLPDAPTRVAALLDRTGVYLRASGQPARSATPSETLLSLSNVTTAERDAITGMAAGDFVFNTTTSTFDGYDGSNWVSLSEGATTGWTYVVETPSDLPDPVGGEIILPPGSAVFFAATTIDFNGLAIRIENSGTRAEQGKNFAMVGTSSETTEIKSTGLVGAFIRGSGTLRLRDISFEGMEGGAKVLDIDSIGVTDAALDWNAVNFKACEVGVIKDYSNFIYTAGAWLESSGLVLDGTLATCEISTSLVNPGAGSVAITFAATCVITRRFRALFSAFIILPGETALKVLDRAATFPENESFFLLNASFTGGGTYLDGISAQDNAALIEDTTGVTNSADVAHYYATGNAVATATAAAGVGVYVKVAGVTTDGASVAKFDQAVDNRAEYEGALTSFFRVSAGFTAISGNNDIIGFKLYKSTGGAPAVAIDDTYVPLKANAAGRVESGATFTIVELAAGDYLELWVANETAATDVVVENFRLAANV